MVGVLGWMGRGATGVVGGLGEVGRICCFFLFRLVRWGVVVELRRRVVLVLVGGQRQGSRRAGGHFHLSARER